jgi:hypothetical protein
MLDDISMEGVFDFLPFVTLEIKNEVISIGGINSGNLIKAIMKIWGTKRLTDNLFNTLTYRRISFHSFFALEVAYILETVYEKFRIKLAREILTKLKEETWIGLHENVTPLDFDWGALNRLNVNMLPHQKQWLESYQINTPRLNLNGNLLHADTGLGKTYMAYMLSLVTRSDISIMLCLKPSLNEVFLETLKSGFKKEPTYWVSDSGTLPTGKEEYLLCHYEAMDKLIPLIPLFKNKKVCINVDESHKFNEATSDRTKNLIRLCREGEIDNVVFSSATPLKAIGKEAVTLLSCIDKTFTQDVANRFVGIFGATTGRALDILNHRLQGVTFRATKKDNFDIEKVEVENAITMPNSKEFTLPEIKKEMQSFVNERVDYYKREMPSIKYSVFEILRRYNAMPGLSKNPGLDEYHRMINEMHHSFSVHQHKDYIKLCKDFEEAELYPIFKMADKKAYEKLISRYKYVMLVIRGEALGRILTKRRIECSNAMIPHSNIPEIIERSTKKTLILCSNVPTVLAMGDYLTKLGYKPELVYQETNSDLQGILERARKQPNVNPIIGTFSSLSTSIPITMCSTLIMHDAPVREYIRQQSIGRIWRIGQDTKCTIIANVLKTGNETNISSRNLDIQAWSKEMVESMLGVD